MRRLLTGPLLLLFGAAFVVGGLWIRSTMQPYDGGIETTAVVVDHDRRTSDDGTTYAAVFEFRTELGEIVQVIDNFASSSPPTIGSEIRVSYERGDPSGARNLDNPAWFPWIFIGVGGVIVLIGLGMMLPLLVLLGVGVGALFSRGDDELFAPVEGVTAQPNTPTFPMENPTGPDSTYR